MEDSISKNHKLLSDFFDVAGVDEDGGAAEHGEADDKGVGAVGVAPYLALESAKVAADYPDGVVDVEFGGSEVDGAVGLTEHKPELINLGIADDGDGSAQRAGAHRAVDHEAIDVWESDYMAALLLGASHEND